MKTPRFITTGLATCVLAAVAWRASGLGADYQSDQPVGGTSAWPEGLKQLVNRTNRVHGFFVNAEDVFFFSGTATNFTEFLQSYAKISGVEQHRMILHEGIGVAKSPWSTNGLPCDWKLDACPKAWLTQNAKEESFILEVHFWTGGNITLDQLAVPLNVEITGGCLRVFEAITNGMSRAEVERRLKLDGGLQGVSPVRFLSPDCPHFKINVAFDFNKDAADQNRALSGKDDKVVLVSKPYLERPCFD